MISQGYGRPASRYAAWITVSLLLAGALPALGAFVTFESAQVRPLAMSPDGTKLFAVNTPDNRLEIFDVGPALSHSTSVSVGMEPVAVAARTNTEVWVVNNLSDSVSIIDLSVSPPHLVRTLLVGDEPRDVVFAGPGGNRAFITTAHRGQQRLAIPPALGGGDPQLTTPGVERADVWVFDADNLGTALGGTPLSIVTLFGDTPRALAVSPDGGTVYAAIFHSGNQTATVPEGAVCDTSPASLSSNTVEGPCTDRLLGTMPGGLPLPHTNSAGDVRPEAGLIVKWNGAHWVDRICPAGSTCSCQGGAGAGTACTEDSNCPASVCGRIWDNLIMFTVPDKDVFAIDANANPPVESRFYTHVGSILFNMAVNPISGKVYVSNGDEHNEVRFEGPGIFGGSTVEGHLNEYRITVLDGPNVLPRHLNKHIDYSVLPAPDGVKDKSLATPMGMAISADGQTLYVAAFGSSKVAVFNTADIENDTFAPGANHILVSGGGPSGLVLDEAHHRLYVLTRFDNGISVIDTQTPTEVDHLSLYNPEPASVVNGRPFLYDAFFTSSNGEASCSSCHPFGDMDDLAWDLGDPDDVKIPNPLPIKLKAAALSPGSDVGSHPDFDYFHPMKGPMITQTLRGLVNHGTMHWRGDRVNQNGDVFDSDVAFRNFRVAFPSLVGRDSEIPEPDMQAFSSFVLQIMMPPNPNRALDNSLTADQQLGKSFMTGPRRVDGFATDFTGNTDGFNCVGCHILDPANGHFGTDGEAAFNDQDQIFKIPQLRSLYQKVGMFGMSAVHFFIAGDNGFKGDQIRSFGFLHDGSVDTVFRFLGQSNFKDDGDVGFNGGDAQLRQVEQFVLAFDSDFAPIVGQQVTLTSTNADVVGPRIDLLIQRAATPFLFKGSPEATECDLTAKGTVDAQARGWVRLSSGMFRSDRAAEPLLTDAQLRALAATPGQELTYTCVPPGSGTRIGIDRDEDGYYDRDELDAGSNPADAGSIPLPSPGPSGTPTSSSIPSETPAGVGSSTPTPAGSSSPTPPPESATATPSMPTPTPPVPSPSLTPTPGALPGDVDGNGVVNATDVDLLVAEIFEGTPVAQVGDVDIASRSGADANGDLRVTAADVVATVQLIGRGGAAG
jgi:DNA-binding beta-propeller fold protein YncE